MSLKSFHIFFISVSSLLAVIMGVWGIYEKNLLLALVGLVTLILLIPYVRWFRQKMKRLAPIVLIAAFIPIYSVTAWACPVCFGDPNSLLTKGAKTGILFLIAVVASVLGAIFAIALSWSKRAKSLPHPPPSPFT